jgi:FtsH-binding integral membrane protein
MPSGLNFDNLMHGQVFELLMTREFWSHYPALPNLQLLLLPSALLVMGLLLASVYYFYLADQRKNQPLAASTVFLLTGFLPYGIGWMALAKNAQPANAGLWLAFMLVAVFYGAAACGLYSAIQLVRKPSSSLQTQG